MVGSDDSLDVFPNLNLSDEHKVIRIDCWQKVSLPKIWIPSYLLPTRKSPHDTRANQGIFHTLQKRDDGKCIESFSVYSDSDDECEQEEIFQSDSDEETLDLDTLSSEKIECTTHKTVEESSAVTANNISLSNKHSKREQSLATNENLSYEYGHSKSVGKLKSKLKSFSSLNNLSLTDAEKSTQFVSSSDKVSGSNQNKSKVNQTHAVDNDEKNRDSCISLHEILDNSADICMSDVLQNLTAAKKDDVSKMQESCGETKKKRNKKKKKKTMKVIGLSEFLEGYDEGDMQNYYCNNYLQKLLAEQAGDDKVQKRNLTEFPDLSTPELRFIHSQEAEIKSEASDKTFSELFAQFRGVEGNPSVDADASEGTTATHELESSLGKIAIENIPLDTHDEDVVSFLSGYGDIKNFSLKRHGRFLKAIAEIDLNHDIDWIIECLNDEQPFGASSATLKCYKL